jgi:hypothetical protein
MSWKYRNDELDFTLGGGVDLASVKGGVRPPASMFAPPGGLPMISTDGVNSTPVITEIYVSAIFIPFTCLCTGIAIFNGTVVATDKVRVLLYDVNGNILRSSAVAGAQPATADGFDNVAFSLAADGTTAATTIVLPSGTYFAGTIYNGTTNRFNAYALGTFPGGKITGAVFATAGVSALQTGVTLPTGFTAANLPPMVALY